MRIALILPIFFTLFATPSKAQLEYLYNDSIPHSALLLSHFVQHSSVTGNERGAGLFFSSVAREKGLHVKYFTSELDTFNFAASLYPLELKKPNILLLNHIDVVPANDADNFTFPPFSGAIDRGKVWGRGAIDNKGMGVMQLLAMERFVELAKQEDLKYNVTLLSVSGEETGGLTGAKVITQRFIEDLNPLVVFGEGGTGMSGILKKDPNQKVFAVSTSCKRRLFLKLTLNLTSSGHGSVPPKSYASKELVYAVNKLVQKKSIITYLESNRLMLRELGRLEGGIRGFALRNNRLFRPLITKSIKKDELIVSLFVNTITLTGINTPEGNTNQIPQSISAILDCRLLPTVKTEDFIADVLKTINNDNIELEILFEDVYADPTKICDNYFKIKRSIQKVYPTAKVIQVLIPASDDNTYFRAVGVPTYGILPVFLDMKYILTIHNTDERIPIQTLEEGIEVYYYLIDEFLNSTYTMN